MDQTGLRNVPYFMEPIDLLMCKHQADTEPYLEANEYKFGPQADTEPYLEANVYEFGPHPPTPFFVDPA